MESIRTYLRWYDIWIGLFIDSKKRTWYICPLPTWAIEIVWKEKRPMLFYWKQETRYTKVWFFYEGSPCFGLSSCDSRDEFKIEKGLAIAIIDAFNRRNINEMVLDRIAAKKWTTAYPSGVQIPDVAFDAGRGYLDISGTILLAVAALCKRGATRREIAAWIICKLYYMGDRAEGWTLGRRR